MVKAVSIKELRKYSKAHSKNNNKELIKISNNKIDDYNFGVVKNYLLNEKKYEVYLFAETEKEIASSLLYKDFLNNFKSNIYYTFLILIIKGHNKNKLLKRISFFLK